MTIEPRLRWAYMDHWRIDSPQGQLSPYTSLRHFDVFLKQLNAVGFEAIETFSFSVQTFQELNGTLKDTRRFMQDRGIDKVLGLFVAFLYDDRFMQAHLPQTHDRMFGYFRHTASSAVDLGVENLVVMPATNYGAMEPVTDDKLEQIAAIWNRVGKMTLEDYGIKICLHHEFFCGLHTRDEILKFYAMTDPKYVFWYCDTAQHVIAGVDPVELYLRLHDRVGGFHLKDTHHVDLIQDFRRFPEAEVTAKTTPRWFWEMGTEGGLVDFPAFFRAIKHYDYHGWITVEHDKADIGGGNHHEATAYAAWYIQNVLEKIYA
jgi:sugar phosphate isomerase/epimerase